MHMNMNYQPSGMSKEWLSVFLLKLKFQFIVNFVIFTFAEEKETCLLEWSKIYLTAARSLVHQLAEPNNREKGKYFQQGIISDRQVFELYNGNESSAS